MQSIAALQKSGRTIYFVIWDLSQIRSLNNVGSFRRFWLYQSLTAIAGGCFLVLLSCFPALFTMMSARWLGATICISALIWACNVSFRYVWMTRMFLSWIQRNLVGLPETAPAPERSLWKRQMIDYVHGPYLWVPLTALFATATLWMSGFFWVMFFGPYWSAVTAVASIALAWHLARGNRSRSPFGNGPDDGPGNDGAGWPCIPNGPAPRSDSARESMPA